MRILRVLASLAPTFLLFAACDDSSSSTAAAFTPEGGAGFEAGTSPVPEAGTDAPLPPVGQGITVTVLDGTKPFANVRVLFHDATGAVIGDQKTDATGKVASATAPSMVTVLANELTRAGALASPVTYMGVADGDKLLVVVPGAVDPTPPAVGKYSVTLPAVDGATTYAALVPDTDCAASANDTSAALEIVLFDRCLGAQNSVLASAYDAVALGYGFSKNVAKPAAGATTDLGLIPLVAPGTTTVTATNLPAEDPNNFRVELIAFANTSSYKLGFSSGTLQTGGVLYQSPTGFADAYQVGLEHRIAAASGDSRQFIARREPTTAPATATLSLDLANALPGITNTTVGQTEVARPDISVISTSPLSSADAGVVRITWSVQFTQASWTFVVPPTMTTFKAPAMPADATIFQPTSGAHFDSVTYFEASQLPGYKEVKALPMSTGFFGPYFLAKPLPAAGTVRVSRLAPNSG
jgi:hypothetical protein